MKNGLSLRKVKTYVSDFSISLFQPRKRVSPHLSIGKLDDSQTHPILGRRLWVGALCKESELLLVLRDEENM